MARIARLPHFAGVILACGCLIGMLGFGPRSGMGFLLTPMSSAHSWGRDVFALALATAPVLSVGAVLYALGLAAMAYAGTPAMLHLSAGVMIGFGLAGSSFTVVIGALGKLMPPQWRSLAFAAPRTNGAAAAATAPQQSLVQALTEALGHRSYWLLVLGFFTCGFQIFFIAVHLPAYLVDRGLAAEIGGWTLGVIGLFNMVGAITAGWLSALMPRRYLLSFIYFARAVAILSFITLPPSAAATLIFGAVLGLLWLSTVPPTSGLVTVMFGAHWLAMLFGFAFFSHQIGGFLGVWLGGVLFERTGSYDLVWWLSILLGLLSAAINLPIVEKPVQRLAAAPA